MYRKSFVKKTISSLTPKRFDKVRDLLNNEHYIPFDFIDAEKIDRPVVEEKLADYFEKVELVAGGKNFGFVIDKYADDLDSVVREHIERNTRSLRNGNQTYTRANKYYEKAGAIRRNGLKSFDNLLDYSRIMLCLYMAIINKKHSVISDFDYSSECLKGSEILGALRGEKVTNPFTGSRNRFDTKAPYGTDRCTFIMIIIMYQYIKSKEVEDDN